MQEQFLNFISQHKLFLKSNKILLAVSGGIDSIALFDLFSKTKFSFAVVHCNFSLRANESDGDEKFVKSLCKKAKVPFYSIKFDTLDYAEKKNISTQMAAREMRYNWFEKIRTELKFDYIATAHHQTDVAETMLINLLRGTGIAGLHGISAKKSTVLRPLLFATRSEIEKYAQQNKLTFREDSSNKEDTYLRNKIRHWVLPQLQKINPTFEQSFYETAGRIAAAEKVFNSSIEAQRKKIERKSKTEIRLPIAKLKKLNPLSIYLYEFLKTYNFNTSSCTAIEKGLENNSGNQFYSETHRLLIDRTDLIISKVPSKNKKTSFKINSAQSELLLPIHLKITKLNIRANFKISKSQHVAQVDASKISFPLEIRRWKKGDAFHPLGMQGSKKISDFFIDNKLSIFDKEKVWLLCSDNKIVWIVNSRLDERFKIGPDTKKIIQLEYFEKKL